MRRTEWLQETRLMRFEDAGLEGLIDKRLSQISHRRAPVDEVMRPVDRYRSRHLWVPGRTGT